MSAEDFDSNRDLAAEFIEDDGTLTEAQIAAVHKADELSEKLKQAERQGLRRGDDGYDEIDREIQELNSEFGGVLRNYVEFKDVVAREANGEFGDEFDEGDDR